MMGRLIPQLLCAGWLIAVAAAGAPAVSANLLENGGFERARGGWALPATACQDDAVARSGNASLRMTAGMARQDLTGLATGTTVTCAAALKLQDVRKTAADGYAFAAVYQLDDFDEVIASHDFVRRTGTTAWEWRHYTFTVAEGCRLVSVRCGLFQAEGTAWFDDFTLVTGGEPREFGQFAEAEREAVQRLGLVPSPRGNIALFKDDIPAAGAPASPDFLRATLRKAGFGAACLTSEQLADGRCLSRAWFDLVILPYGDSFPVAAADNFRRFLRDGGKFLSMGGYAFDHLLERTAKGWEVPSAPARPALEHALWQYAIPAERLRGQGRLTFRGFLKAAHISGPGMAYFAVYQLAADGALVEWRDLCRARGSQDWTEVRCDFAVNPKAAHVELRAGLYRCQGVACFDDVTLADAAGKVLLQGSFEDEFEPAQRGPERWVRSDAKLCEVQARTRRSGRRALQVRLGYEEPKPERLNTRFGVPEDGLRVEPTQLGVFDADYFLERVHSARAAPGQAVVAPSWAMTAQLEGYAASGVVGFNAARWVPLLNAYDRYGRLRGAVGAMLRHYAGTYAGSSWCFFGVTNRSLFAESEPAAARLATDLAEALVRDTYVAYLVSEPACYRQGETVRLLATIVNGSRSERNLVLQVDIDEGEPDRAKAPRAHRTCARLEAACTVAPGATNLVALVWKPRRFQSAFYHLRGRLCEAGKEVDLIESGFVVQDEGALRAGPNLRYRDNYLHFGQRPLFLFGADDWGYVFTMQRETPLQWLQDMRQRRDFGVLIYENLQFGLPGSPEETERLLRKVDGVVQLAQQHGQVYFPGLLIGFNVAASNADLARQKQYCRAFAQRYAPVPGLIYYFNGDLRCELSAAVTPQWNEFLRARYGDERQLQAAWGSQAPSQELGKIPAEDFNDWGHAWDDVKVYDLNSFRAWLIRRWCGELIAGVREFDQVHPTTCEFYQLPHQGIDLPAGMDGLDLSNFGYFDRPRADLARFPAICKYNDQRARGKSVGPGEYGAKTHPAWADGQDHGYHTARTRGQALDLFLAIAHYSLGLGASRIHNWCWKDDAHRVFPWGMTYPCDNVPKDILYAHRNQSLLFRHFTPVYREPSVFVLTADSHRLGGGKWQVIEGILRGIELALATHVENLGVLNEQGLQIPASAKVLFYPLPFCPADETYAKVLRWVKAGGTLYLSGDISYDELRRRTRADRLEELCGVRFQGENYPNIGAPATGAAAQPCINVEPLTASVLRRAASGAPCLLQNRLGQGTVLYSTDPIELHPSAERQSADLAIYRSVLQIGRVSPLGLVPDDPLLHLFRLPMKDGGQVYVLFNTDETQPERTVSLSDCHPAVALTIARRRPALVWFDRSGCLRAVEVQGACRLGTDLLLTDETNGAALSLDGQDLRKSRAVLLMPLEPGKVQLATSARWRRPVAEVGEVHNGAWRGFEFLPAVRDDGLTVELGRDQVLSLVLLCEQSDLPRWRRAVQQAMTDPGSLP
jgi:hypothetical protein